MRGAECNLHYTWGTGIVTFSCKVKRTKYYII